MSAIQRSACIRVLWMGIVISACQPPTSSDERRSLGPFELDPAVVPGETLDRELIVIGDPATTAMTIDIETKQFAPAPPGAPTPTAVTISTGDGTSVQTITANGRVNTSSIDGNVARVRLTAPGGVPLPNVTLFAVTLTRSSAPVVPADANALANRLSAVPLTAGQTVDFAYPEREIDYFFSFRAPRDGVYDFVYFGPGRLWLMSANDPDYPLTLTNTVDTVPKPGTTVPFVRITMTANEVRRMRADNAGAGAGRARVVVMETTEMQKLAFPSQTPSRFAVLTPGGVDHGGGYPADAGPLETWDCKNWEGSRAILSNAPLPGFRPATLVPRCYQGHQGTDWPIVTPAPPPFQIQANVAASGVVFAVDDTHFDGCFWDVFSLAIRCPSGFLTTAAPVDNFIAIRQDDGLFAYYVHGGTGSAMVVPGQKVACGELLFVVSSAGNSTGPHLHFELQNITSTALTDSDRFTNMALITPQGQSFRGIRTKADSVDAFGPVNRWRSLGPANVPSDACR